MRSNNKIADSLLASAHDSAVHDGLRLAVPRYLEAADALVAESRHDEAAKVLLELLAAKEKRRGLFIGKREISPLGNQRELVATKYAQLIYGTVPSEESLDMLSQIAIEFPDDFDIRLTNADALRQAGYLLDALDEFKYCKSRHSQDVDLDVKIAELYCQLGRTDEGVAQARQAIAQFSKSDDEDAVATLAARILDFAPNAFEESFDAFASLSADALARHRAAFDTVVAAFARVDMQDPARRGSLVDALASAYEKLLSRDRTDQSLWQVLATVDPGAADKVRAKLDGKTAAAAAAVAPPEPAVAPREPAGGAPPATSAPPPAVVSAVVTDAEVPTALAPVQTPTPAPAEAPAAAAAASAAPLAAPKRPAASGLSAFTKRKAFEMFANSEYEAASVQLERVVKMSPDVEALEMLLECYLVLDRHDEAARIGVQLADAELAAGNKPGAIATLTTLSKKIANPSVEQRRVELLQRP